MNALFDTLESFLDLTPMPPGDRAVPWLAAADDLAELEQQMRQWDARCRAAVVGGPYGLFVR